MKRILTMATLLAAAVPLALLKSVPAHAEGMEISPDAARPPTAGSADFFIGDVLVKPLFNATEYTDTSGVRSPSPQARAVRGTPIPLARR